MADSSAHDADIAADQQPTPVVVKKYANRRLYNTETSSYVTLEDLAAMVRGGRDFAVYDAKSGEDITRSVLTQIIVDEESKGRCLLPESFLRHLIGFYGDSLQTVLPRYLELAMAGFARQQEQMRRSVEQAMGGFLPFGGLEEMGKQQKAMMERAMSLFSPFLPHEPPTPPAPPSAAPSVEALQSEIASLKRQLDELRATGKPPPR
ncbi:MAG: polyhydroxyalkanoate synthesis repressor PhaR [Acetobacteraceae bacterium]|nr:polyhydroxyalkanoate synthesis repressor PhaR [Acetobacteraceae bacterium]